MAAFCFLVTMFVAILRSDDIFACMLTDHIDQLFLSVTCCFLCCYVSAFDIITGMTVSLLIISAAIRREDSPLASLITILGLATYLAFFSTGLGPGNWVVVSEVFATSIRAKAMSVAVFPNRVTATICASTFLTLAHVLTWSGFFCLLAAICLASCAFLYVFLPETNGKSLEQMSHYFAELMGDRSILDVEEKLQAQRR